jgi:hypothetical protein
VITPNLFPGASISSDLGNGPGIQEVATFSVDVEGPEGSVAVANAHGTVTGAAGGVLLRPFARLISGTGDSVTTYGEPWNITSHGADHTGPPANRRGPVLVLCAG